MPRASLASPQHEETVPLQENNQPLSLKGKREEEKYETVQNGKLGKLLEGLPRLLHHLVAESVLTNLKAEQNKPQFKTELSEIIKDFTDLIVAFQEQEQSRASAVEGIRAIVTNLPDEQRQQIEAYLDLIQTLNVERQQKRSDTSNPAR